MQATVANTNAINSAAALPSSITGHSAYSANTANNHSTLPSAFKILLTSTTIF